MQWRFESDDSWNGRCRVIRVMRNNSKSAMLRMPSLLESRSDLLHLWTSLSWKRIQSTFWRLDALSIPHYVIKKGWPRGARHGKIGAQKEHFIAHNARRRCIKKIFGGIHDRFIQFVVTRNSKLAGPRRSASQWINWHRKTTPAAHPLRNVRDIGKTGISLNKSGKNAPMSLRSDFWTTVTIMNRLLRESGEERPEPIPFHQYQRLHSSSSSSSSWWQWDKNWWGIYFFSLVVAGLFTADGKEV